MSFSRNTTLLSLLVHAIFMPLNTIRSPEFSDYPLTVLRFYLLPALIMSPCGSGCEYEVNTAHFSPHDHVHRLILGDFALISTAATACWRRSSSPQVSVPMRSVFVFDTAPISTVSRAHLLCCSSRSDAVSGGMGTKLYKNSKLFPFFPDLHEGLLTFSFVH